MLYTAETLAELARSCEERRLFNGCDLTGWYTYLKGRGRNCDPKGVFTVTNGVIHVTGEEFGALVTETEYANYRLSLDYRFLGASSSAVKPVGLPTAAFSSIRQVRTAVFTASGWSPSKSISSKAQLVTSGVLA